MNKLTGYVLWFNERDGNGIIKTDAGVEYYTDISVTPNREPLKRNQRVEFEHNPRVKDCRCAWKIELLDNPDKIADEIWRKKDWSKVPF